MLKSGTLGLRRDSIGPSGEHRPPACVVEVEFVLYYPGAESSGRMPTDHCFLCRWSSGCVLAHGPENGHYLSGLARLKIRGPMKSSRRPSGRLQDLPNAPSLRTWFVTPSSWTSRRFRRVQLAFRALAFHRDMCEKPITRRAVGTVGIIRVQYPQPVHSTVVEAGCYSCVPKKSFNGGSLLVVRYHEHKRPLTLLWITVSIPVLRYINGRSPWRIFWSPRPEASPARISHGCQGLPIAPPS